MVEGARLESGYTLIAYRGFESLSHRQYINAAGIDILAVRSGAESEPVRKFCPEQNFTPAPQGQIQDAFDNPYPNNSHLPNLIHLPLAYIYQFIFWGSSIGC